MLDKANIAADTDFRQKKEETAKNAKKEQLGAREQLTARDHVAGSGRKSPLPGNSMPPGSSPQRLAPFYDGRIFWRTDRLIFWTDGFLDGRFQKKFLTDS